MTVTEIDSPSRTSLVLPFPPAFPAELDEWPQPLPALSLNSPNLEALPTAQKPKAEALLQTMQDGLEQQCMDHFNEAKRAFLAIFKKYGEPITQWNPLVLVLNHPGLLKGYDLGTINLEMVHLRAIDGQAISLAGANLQSGLFLCSNLSRMTLTDADLSGADLRFVDLSEANLERAVLVEANLSHANLSFANFRDANLYCGNLNGAVAKQACFQNANLRKADLRHVDFYQAELMAARLQHADLREANLFMADLCGAKLRQADLRHTNLGFSRLQDVRLQNARLSGANLNNADLTHADLHDCCLQGALFNRTLVREANLTALELVGLDLSECLALEEAKLENAVYNAKTLFPKGFKAKKHGLVTEQCTGLKRISQLVSSILG